MTINILPANQSYVPGSWAPGVVVVNENELTFTDGAAFREGPYNQVYTFDAIVTGGTTNDPYTEIQTNVTNVLWDVTPLGPQQTNSASKDIDVNVPHIIAEKRQRNATKGGAFTKLALTNVDVGDIIEYEITITNDGENTAYSIVTIDDLDLAFTFNSLVSIPPGVITTPVGPGGQVRWELNPPDSLAVGASLTLIFAVEVNVGFSPGDTIVNQSSTEYESSDTPDSITLGPSLSNQVTLNLTLPIITKSVNKQAHLVGDIVEYTVEFTIPEGGIVYDVQVKDLLPATQSYVVGSLYKQVNADPLVQINPIQILPELIFENPTDIDASLEEITIRYFFEATIDSIVNTPEDIQTNTSTIYWNEQSGADPGTPQSDSVDIYVTNTIPLTEKAQRNFTEGGAFTILPINAAVGDIIYYRYEVTNNSANSIYNVVIEDVLDQFIQTVGPVSIPATGVFLQTGNTIKISITEIAASDTVTAIVAYRVIQGIGTEGIIPNSLTTTYDVNNTTPNLQYGPIDSNEVQLILPPLSVNKRVDLETVEIGQIIEYFIDVTVPNGTIAYNVAVVDTLPAGQIYVGEAAIDGVQTFPSISGQIVTFAPIEIDATSGEKTVVFSFKARVVTGELEAPYTEIQTNNVEVNYETDPLGTEGTPQNASKDVTVNSPNVFIAKSQRNVTKDTGYTTDVINVDAGDVLEFKIVAHNFGLASAYNILITDDLGQFEEFVSIESVSLGNANYDLGTNTVIWTIDTLLAGSIETLIIRVRVKGGISAGGTNNNIANGIYDTNTVTPITLGPISSNEVIQRYPNIRISKTSDITYAVIGDIITYTVEFTIPKGTVIYNGQFTDVIPIGQQYNDNATLNGNPVIAQVNGQSIAFPSVPFAQAGEEDLVFVYTFETKVISANPDNITLVEVQTNNAQGNWGLAPDIPATPVNSTDDIIVTDSLIGIEKLQRNVTQGELFTDLGIEGFTEDIIEYKLTVTNTGLNTVYDVKITDDLPLELDFIQTISVDKGTITELPNNFITWNIPTLLPGETAEAVISLEIISTEEKTIENISYGKFRVTLANPNYFGNIPSNTVEIDLLGPPFSFLPVPENRESDTEAISYGVGGCAGKVGYELLSESSQPTSYMLSIDPLIVDYDIYIDNVFVTSVSKNTPYSDTPNQLKDLLQGDSRLIELRYYTPKDIAPGTIDTFNITASASTSKTISTDILFGAVNISLKYKTFVYSNSYDVEYTIIVNVLENIKVYDFNLVSIFSNVFTFEDATLDGNPIIPVVNNNMVTFHNISEIEGPETLVYKYRVSTEDMKDVSTGYARIVEAYGLFKSSETFEDRCRINAKFINTIKNECIIADKVYSQCQNRVCFENIPLNTPDSFYYDSISFDNGNIIPGTLKIESIKDRTNFKRVTFDVSVPYKIIFRDSEGNTITKHRTLPVYNIDVVLYMPDTRDEIKFRVILDTLSELLRVDKENNTITVGVFNKISVALRVQLFMPVFDYCDIPPICEDYNQCIFEDWLE